MSISSRASLLSTAKDGQIPEALAQRLGKPTERPALRSDLVIRHLVHMGESKWVIKNPETRTIHTFNDVDYAFMLLYDGSRTPEEIRDAYNAEHPGDLIEVNFVLDYEETLQQTGLLAQSGSQRGLAVMKRLRDARKFQAEEKEKRFNIFFMLFPVADPDRFLDKTIKYVRWIWSPEIVALAFVMFALTTAVFIRDFSRIWTETFELYALLKKPLLDLLEFYFILTIIGSFHELGHAYAMKLYGGEVHSIGFALFFFLPAYFTDTLDSELFESKWHRLCVNVGGIYIESWICVIMTAIWVVTYPDTFVHDFAYKGMLYTGVSTVIFNINPLTPTDGYHCLEDILEIPGLRPESFHYIGMLIQKYLFRLPVEVPMLSRRKRRVFLIYGSISVVYTGMVMLAVGAIFAYIFHFFAGELTSLLTTLMFVYMFRKRLRKFTDVLKMFYLDKKEKLMSPIIKRRIAVGAGVVLLLLALPLPHETLDVSMALKPAMTVQVTAPADATVASVNVREGERVEAGAVLARLSSRAVASRVRELTARKDAFEGQASRSREEASAAGSADFESRARAAAVALQVSEAVSNALLVKAPVGGTVMTRRPEDLVGSSVQSGMTLFTLGDTSSMRAEMPVTERLIQSMRVGEPVALHVRALPYRRYRAKISAIAPAAETLPPTSRAADEKIRPAEIPEKFVAVAVLPNADGALRSGTTVDAKLLGKRTPLLVQWWKVFYDWTRRIIW